jgi:hypothetical protein
MTTIPSDYDLDNIKDEALRRALNAAKAEMRAARSVNDQQAALHAVRRGAAELAVYSYDPGFNDAIANLTAVACHVEGLPPHEVVSAIDEALKERGAKAEAPLKAVTIDDFWAHMPSNKYIFAPTGELWPKGSVNAYIPPVVTVVAGKQQEVPASNWLMRNQRVEQMTWWPGLAKIVYNRLTTNGGWIERDGVACFNLYRSPLRMDGDPAKASPWIDHAYRMYGDDAEHLIMWFGHRVQRPGEKINHAIVLGGLQGIGKDTLIEPVKSAIGSWNFQDVSPKQLTGRFNPFLKSVVLRINEARDLGDLDRFGFYDHMKTLTASPPDVLYIDEKNTPEYYITNVLGVIITTNHKADGIYLPADDRRHYVAWSNLTKDSFEDGYFPGMWDYYERENGRAHVAAYLANLDLSGFDPKAPPPKTDAFWDIVQASRVPEDAEVQDAIDKIAEEQYSRQYCDNDGRLLIVTINDIKGKAEADFGLWLGNRGNTRRIPHRLEACGYTPVRNPNASDGLWKIDGRRQAVYGLTNVSQPDLVSVIRKRWPKLGGNDSY